MAYTNDGLGFYLRPQEGVRESVSREVKRSVAGYSALNLAGNGLRIVLSFITVIFASRWLGASDFGKASLILAYTGYLYYLLTLGFDYGLPFFIGGGRKGADARTGASALRVGLTISTVVALLVFLLAWFIVPPILERAKMVDLFWPVVIFTVQMWVGAVGYIFGGYLRGMKTFIPVILKDQILFPAFHFLGLFLLVKMYPGGVMGYSIGYSCATLFSVVYAGMRVLAVRRMSLGRSPAPAWPVKQWKSWVSYSFPLAIMGGLEPFLVSISVMMAGWHFATGEVAKIVVSLRVAVFVQFLLVVLAPVYSPYMADLWKRGRKKELGDLYRTMSFWSSKWSILLAFFLASSSDFVMRLFGGAYGGAGLVLLMILPGTVFEGCLGVSRLSLIMAGRNKANAILTALAIGLNLLFGNLLAPHYGLMGIAGAFSLSWLALNLGRIAWYRAVSGSLPFDVSQVRYLAALIAVLSGCWWAISLLGLSQNMTMAVSSGVFLAGLIWAYWGDRDLFLSRFIGRNRTGKSVQENS